MDQFPQPQSQEQSDLPIAVPPASTVEELQRLAAEKATEANALLAEGKAVSPTESDRIITVQRQAGYLATNANVNLIHKTPSN